MGKVRNRITHLQNECSSVESAVNAEKATIIFTELCKTKPISIRLKLINLLCHKEL